MRLCRDCDNVHADTRKLPPWQWRCSKLPEPVYGGFVDPDYRPHPPYVKCEKINDKGRCQWWTPRRDGKPKVES